MALQREPYHLRVEVSNLPLEEQLQLVRLDLQPLLLVGSLRQEQLRDFQLFLDMLLFIFQLEKFNQGVLCQAICGFIPFKLTFQYSFLVTKLDENNFSYRKC